MPGHRPFGLRRTGNLHVKEVAVFRSRFMPCPDCGESVERGEPTPHVCDPARVVEFQMFGLRREVDRLDDALREHLATPSGRFEAWMAWHEVRRTS